MISLSADIGGTFTDVILADSKRNKVYADKVLSTPGSSDAVIEGILQLTRQAGIQPADIDVFVHGFTIATNAWLTRSGARVVLAVTDGFRDVLEIATQRRPLSYSLTQSRPAPLVPRSRAVQIKERVDAFGQVCTALSSEEARHMADAIAALEPEAVAICLLFSHLNPVNEQRLMQAVRERLPGIPVYCSSEVNPQAEEYPRTNTTVTCAYVGPVVDKYIRALEAALPTIGVKAPVLLMRSDGGVSTIQAARGNPVNMLLSGPAGGVIAGMAASEDHGIRNIITFDMGGTSADFSLISNGEALTANERLINGEVLRLSTLDISTISAGGGSIGAVDLGGAIRVGPASAGSVPGPACYGLGGVLPTLSDAALVMGLLDPSANLAGGLRLDIDKARQALKTEIADKLDVSIDEAAYGMVAIANAQMAQAIRSLSVERGYDLRDFALLSFGGAGSIFAPFLMQELEMQEIVIPLRPGVFSASGMLLSDMRHTFQAPFLTPVNDVDQGRFTLALKGLDELVSAAFKRDGIAQEKQVVRYYADLRYVGQVHELTVPLAGEAGAVRWDPAVLSEQFRRHHERAYGFADASMPCEIVNLRVEGIGLMYKPKPEPLAAGSSVAAPTAMRQVYLGPELGRRTAAVYDRADLRQGQTLHGPSIVNQSDTTIFILPGQSATVGLHGVLRVVAGIEEN